MKARRHPRFEKESHVSGESSRGMCKILEWISILFSWRQSLDELGSPHDAVVDDTAVKKQTCYSACTPLFQAPNAPHPLFIRDREQALHTPPHTGLTGGTSVLTWDHLGTAQWGAACGRLFVRK